jgi:hypothetical protein
MTDDDGAYCSVYETLTKCRFFAVGQQSACRGFGMASHARRCMWWMRLEDNSYRCGNPDSQAWAAAQHQKQKEVK